MQTEGLMVLALNKVMECTCNKTKYGSQKDADWDIERIRKKSKRSVVPIRSYKCKSGCWHITSKEDMFKILKDEKKD